MSGVQEFIKFASEKNEDLLGQFLVDLQDSAAPKRIETLKQFHQQLTQEIDQINRRRNTNGSKVRNLLTLIEYLDEFGGKNPPEDLRIMRMFLMEWHTFLKRSVEESRPGSKLEKKYEIEHKIETLNSIQQLASVLGEGLKVSKKEQPKKTEEVET